MITMASRGYFKLELYGNIKKKEDFLFLISSK